MGIGGEIMRLGIFGIGLAAALAVGGCATGAESGPDRYYACSDGSRIGVSFLSQDAVRVRLPSRKNLILPLVSEDAGNRYADERHELRSEEHTSELQSLMRISYAVFCLKKKNTT